MAESPFRNFDPEALNIRTVINRPIAGSHAVTDLLRRATIACGSGRISNGVIAKLIERVGTYDAPLVPRRVSFADYYSDSPTCLELEGITAQQYNAARALLLLDEALDMVAVSGWTADVADRLLLASAWVSDATEKAADDEKWRAIIDGEREAAHQKSLRSRDVKPANDAKHARRREDKAAALEFYKTGTWGALDKCAAITIADKFNVPLKTAQNWITAWRKAGAIA